MLRWGNRVTPLRHSQAELSPCDQTALEILGDAIRLTQGAQGL
jgi:3-oxoacyl-[acyl-carrier-protein] synthase-3